VLGVDTPDAIADDKVRDGDFVAGDQSQKLDLGTLDGLKRAVKQFLDSDSGILAQWQKTTAEVRQNWQSKGVNAAMDQKFPEFQKTSQQLTAALQQMDKDVQTGSNIVANAVTVTQNSLAQAEPAPYWT
jgi:hypothetical protein